MGQVSINVPKLYSASSHFSLVCKEAQFTNKHPIEITILSRCKKCSCFSCLPLVSIDKSNTIDLFYWNSGDKESSRATIVGVEFLVFGNGLMIRVTVNEVIVVAGDIWLVSQWGVSFSRSLCSFLLVGGRSGIGVNSFPGTIVGYGETFSMFGRWRSFHGFLFISDHSS